MDEKRGKLVHVSDDHQLSDSQTARMRLRRRWEFASVLNFIRVFEPILKSDLKYSAEEIETAIIKPNNALAQIHIALLKGIPPVSRNMADNDAWVTVVCKKLDPWWPWVAEGENPLQADHGKEIIRYKELDPITRMLILKALCEVRAEQDDVLRYITEELKNGTKVETFRKERLGNDDNGVTYWYDGDPVIGHRLYKEIVRVESKQKSKQDHSTEPIVDLQWETVATNLEEFQEISESLSSSESMAEAAVGETIKIEIIPVLEELEKKKERALKRQQRQALLIDGFSHTNDVGISRSRRERRPVNYTFDDYDRSISEAIQISKTLKTTRSGKADAKQVEHVPGQKDAATNGSENVDKENSNSDEVHESQSDIEDNGKDRSGSIDSDDAEDDDYEEKDEDHEANNSEDQENDTDDHENDTDENDIDGNDTDDFVEPPRRADPRLRQNPKTFNSKLAGTSLRSRLAKPRGTPEMKKRLRQRPTRNNARIVSESEDDSSDNGKQTKMVSDTEAEASGSSSDESQADSGDE